MNIKTMSRFANIFHIFILSIFVAGFFLVAKETHADDSLVACKAPEIEDSTANREMAVNKYLSVQPMRKVLSDMTTQISQTLPENQKREFETLMNEKVNVDVIEVAARQSMMRHFTAREILFLAQFYSSPEGRSVMSKFPKYMTDVMPVVQNELARAAQSTTKPQATP